MKREQGKEKKKKREETKIKEKKRREEQRKEKKKKRKKEASDPYRLSHFVAPLYVAPFTIPGNGKPTSELFWSRKSVFRIFPWILEELGNFRRQNQLPRENLLQIYRFSAPRTEN